MFICTSLFHRTYSKFEVKARYMLESVELAKKSPNDVFREKVSTYTFFDEFI